LRALAPRGAQGYTTPFPAQGGHAMHFVIHAVDRPGIIEERAKHFRAHRIHLDESRRHGVDIFTAGPLVAEDGETPVGSLFIIEAKDRAAVDAFTRSDPYFVNGVWGRVDVHYYRKKR
jgi:hypothetical protein